jgi:hypothetical protein
MKYKDVFSDLIYVYPISKETYTDIQYTAMVKELSIESPIATPLYQIEFKKALSPIRKYYSKLIANTTTLFLNEIIEESKKDKIDVEYEYTLKSFKTRLEQYFHFIKEHIENNQLVEDLYQTPSKDLKSDEAYVIHLMKYNCIMLYMELQERFKSYMKFDILENEEIQETYLYEETPKELIIIPYDGTPVLNLNKVIQNTKQFISIKEDLEERTPNEKIISFKEIINKKDLFSNLEYKLYGNNIIDENYNFIIKKGNKLILAAFILQLKNKDYLNEFIFPGRKQIKDSKITDFFFHRYGNNSDTDKEFRNFKGKQALKFKQLVEKTYWLDQIT